MTNESPGFEPRRIPKFAKGGRVSSFDSERILQEMRDAPCPGEVLPADAQAILKADHETRRMFTGAGLDVDRLMVDMIRTAAEFNSLARLDDAEHRAAGGSR